MKIPFISQWIKFYWRPHVKLGIYSIEYDMVKTTAINLPLFSIEISNDNIYG